MIEETWKVVVVAALQPCLWRCVSRMFCRIVFWLIVLLLLTPAVRAQHRYSPSMLGALGLNTVPSARMDEPGTVRQSASVRDPYLHAELGLQIAEPLYISLRQSALTSDLNGQADRLYPGVDLKLRLLRETRFWPETTIGLQSAFGHRRMAGEYLAFSKRYKNFDFTAGMAWGRLGSAAHMSNPLKIISSHFGKERPLDGEMPNNIEDWFTGEDIGFFAGIAYFPSTFDGDLSLKFDWGADRYRAEAASLGFNAPAPWSAGLNFHPESWISMGAATIGGDIFIGTLSLRAPLAKWPLRAIEADKPAPMRPFRIGLTLPDEIAGSARRKGIILRDMRTKGRAVWARLADNGHMSMPQQMGRAARHMANHSNETIEAFHIIPTHYGLRGPALRLLRRDLEQALVYKQGSPQEIWRNTKINKSMPDDLYGKSGTWQFTDYVFREKQLKLSLLLDNEFSLLEEDSGLLYRTSLVVSKRQQLAGHVVAGGALRLNLKDNLARLDDIRPRLLLPVRGDIASFAERTVGLDRLYASYLTSLNTDWHFGITGGYLEEMYQGFGGEILYRPYGKTFAIGAEVWQVFKRDPETPFNLGMNGDHLLTGHVNAWYEIPRTALTLQARAGRFLAADIGGTLALEKRFDNGVYIKGFVTATDQADFDVFGGTTHLYSGIEITLPFGDLPVIPAGSAVRFAAMPLGRNTGQALDKPLSLYELTEPLSSRHIIRHWTALLD